jgi:hypothetical protein
VVFFWGGESPLFTRCPPNGVAPTPKKADFPHPKKREGDSLPLLFRTSKEKKNGQLTKKKKKVKKEKKRKKAKKEKSSSLQKKGT